METDALPDSGGHYYDKAHTGIRGTFERNVSSAVSAFQSGEAGSLVAGFTVASLTAWAVKRVVT